MPLVSVIIPTYNSAEFLLETLESVFAQTYQNLEVILVDDGSTDGTRRLIEPYLSRLTYVYQDNAGESSARNHAIEMAQGEFLAFLDSDDTWLPDKLEKQLACLEGVPEAVVCYSPCYFINAVGAPVEWNGSHTAGNGPPEPFEAFERLAMDNFIPNPGTAVVRRSRAHPEPWFDPQIEWGEDWDLWLRLSFDGAFVYLPEPLASYRMRKPDRRRKIEASAEFVRQNEMILGKAFGLADERNHSSARLRSNAFGQLYLRSAMYNFEIGEQTEGNDYLGQAFRSDPNLLMDVGGLARRIADEALRVSANGLDAGTAERFVERVLAGIPETASQKAGLSGLARAELHAALAFKAYGRGARTAVVSNVGRALRDHPAMLANRGLVSIFIRSILGAGKGAG
jgi:glycosyltransferase involved in cell wall biosynthesis